MRLILPEILEFILEIKLATKALYQPVIPLIRRDVLADGCQVNYRDGGSAFTQSAGGAYHQG